MSDLSIIHLVGVGIQCKLSSKYFAEVEMALGQWHGHESPDNTDYGSDLTYFNFGINRILSKKYIHGR